jgi:hypothetical protein
MRTCVHCEDEFDHTSREKQRVGGKINECPDCVVLLGTEKAPVSVGVGAGDGKTTLITIMRFPNQKSADAYVKAYKNSTGFNKGKSCHLGSTNIMHTDRLGGVVIAEFGGNSNHKGKL